jgi:G:T-mismatch repair DNA endonuclease (very short patch repair protein)
MLEVFIPNENEMVQIPILTSKLSVTKEQLYDSYVMNRLSTSQISKLYGCSKSLVVQRLRKYNIPTRSLHEALSLIKRKLIVEIPEEQLRDLYLTKKLSVVQTAKKLNYSTRKVVLNLRKFKIRRRGTSFTKEILSDLYLVKMLSTIQIAESLNCNAETVRNYLRKYKIPLRTKFEAQHIVANRPEQIEIFKKRMAKVVVPYEDSYPEMIIQYALDELGIKYNKHQIVKAIYAYHKFDFFIPNMKILIEMDGCRWHACQIHYPNPKEDYIQKQVVRDRKYDRLVEQEGTYRLIRFWEHDVVSSDHTKPNPEFKSKLKLELGLEGGI